MISKHPLFLVIGTLLSLTLTDLSAQNKTSSSRVIIEKNYSNWRDSMRLKNFKAWKKYTARHSQVQVRNQIISQKQPFPKALFELPITPPSIVPLKLVSLKENDHTLHALYFGKVDFGVTNSKIPENLLLLKFTKESKTWKYDNSRFYNLEGQDQVRQQLKNKNYSSLDQLEFDLPKTKPTPDPLVAKPDYVGEIIIKSLGIKSMVSINGYPTITLSETETAALIPGGLRKGENPIKITVTELPESSAKKLLSVEVFAYTNSKKPKPVKVFKLAPSDIKAQYNANIFVEPLNIR